MMKKIIRNALVLGSLLVSSIALAQQASTPTTAILPTQPNPPSIVTTSPNELEASSLATTNKVYINQGGGNVSATIQQTGVTNIIGTKIDPIYLRGDNQTVTATQTGNSNTLLMGVIGSTGGAASGTTTTIQQLGNNNSADIRCGTYQGDASCNGLNLNAKFAGDNNMLAMHGAANNITTTIDSNGNNNSFTITALSPNSSQNLYFNGSFNNVSATQSGAAGQFGHSLFANFTGNNNTITTQQYGASETVINLNSTGSNGTFNIKTGH
jgi:hypothetical protein